MTQTFIVFGILALAVAYAVWRIVRRVRGRGRGDGCDCGCGCEGCPYSGHCQK